MKNKINVYEVPVETDAKILNFAADFRRRRNFRGAMLKAAAGIILGGALFFIFTGIKSSGQPENKVKNIAAIENETGLWTQINAEIDVLAKKFTEQEKYLAGL